MTIDYTKLRNALEKKRSLTREDRDSIIKWMIEAQHKMWQYRERIKELKVYKSNNYTSCEVLVIVVLSMGIGYLIGIR